MFNILCSTVDVWFGERCFEMECYCSSS